jgi:hypothetical protein
MSFSRHNFPVKVFRVPPKWATFQSTTRLRHINMTAQSNCDEEKRKEETNKQINKQTNKHIPSLTTQMTKPDASVGGQFHRTDTGNVTSSRF